MDRMDPVASRNSVDVHHTISEWKGEDFGSYILGCSNSTNIDLTRDHVHPMGSKAIK